MLTLCPSKAYLTPASSVTNHGALVTTHGPRFGWQVGVDVGTSMGANAKMALYDDNWNLLGTTKQSQRIALQSNNNPQIIDTIGAQIASLVKALSYKIPPGQGAGKTIIFFTPEQAPNGVVSNIDNLRSSIKNLDLKQEPADVQAHLDATNPFRVSQGAEPLTVSPQTRLLVLNDMAGGSAKAVDELAKRYPNKFRPGLDALYLMTGGGLGNSGIRYTDDGPKQIHIDLSELGWGVPYQHWNAKGQKVTSQPVAGVYELLDDFAYRLPSRFSNQRSSLPNLRDAKLITDYNVAQYVLPGLTLREHQAAAAGTSRLYIDSLGYVASLKIADGCNLAILGGRVATGIKDFVNQNPQAFLQELRAYENMPIAAKVGHGPNKSTFDKVFLSRLYQANPNVQNQFEHHHFDVISDLNVINNAQGTPYISKGWFSHRVDRFTIPVEAFDPSKEGSPHETEKIVR
jgi:hypothetical protein